MTEYLFVYGTLRPGLAPKELLELIKRWRRIGAGVVRGRLYNLGEYPGAILDLQSDSCIIGEVLELSDDQPTFAVLDEYEGFDFVRQKCEVILDGGGKLECWIYVYNRQIGSEPLIVNGDYLCRR